MIVFALLSNPEMEMVRESRARDAKDGVDRNACIVDRNQFFNTQVRNVLGNIRRFCGNRKAPLLAIIVPKVVDSPHVPHGSATDRMLPV